MLDLLKLAGILALIIALLRLHWNLGLVLLLASALTGLLFGLPPLDVGRDILTAALDPLTLRLIAIVLLITFLGEILRRIESLAGLVRSLGDLFVDRRWLLALMPMLIGMLPMAGGALFSAPMVQEASQDLDVSPERRTFLNYWFRHSLESVFPLYPSLVLAAGLMEVPVQTLTRTQFPLFVAMLVSGILFGLLGIPRAAGQGGGRPARRETLLLLGKSIWPIALVLGLALLVGVDLILSLLLTLAALVAVHRLGRRQVWEAARGTSLSAVPILIGAMAFRHILETSSAVLVVSRAFGQLGIPVAAVLFAVPLIAGLLTGLAVPAFAIAFPIVLPLCGGDPIASGCGLWIYSGGLVGLLLSPVHLCLALTRDYFGASWGGVYRRLLPAALLVALTAALVALLR